MNNIFKYNFEQKISKFISLVLRHKPDLINIDIDDKGYTDIDSLISNINKYKNTNITKNDLISIVNNDEKGRYSFNDNITRIRANQGHSINVNIEFEKVIPEHDLYHGTKFSNFNNIKSQGLLKMSRQFVHLSKDINIAADSGKRWKEDLLICKIDTKSMINDGYIFFKSENNVYLIKYIPPEYITFLKEVY